MKRATFLQKMLWLMFVPFLVTACEDKMDEHYEVPEWAQGNAWEVLASGEHGNYSIFLQGAELAGFKPVLEGKTIVTVMAPDDEAFTAYLQQHGYSSIQEVPEAELEKIIGYHLVYYSYTKDNFVNFRPNGDLETDDEQQVGAGLYYKHRTRSSDEPTLETNAEGKQVMVYHLERFLPVFSYRYFQSNGISAPANYEALYPGSTWSGNDGFNVSNASVKEYEIPTINGYIYTVDRVIEPLETIYKELQRRDEYAGFLQLYDRVGGSQYVYDSELSSNYGTTYGVDSIFQLRHTHLPSIACEWPTTNYTAFATLTSMAYTVFAPSNRAINRLFDSFWRVGGYSSIDEVDNTALRTLFGSYGISSMLFPESIEQRQTDDELGFELDASAITDRIMCLNGILYGLDEIKVPDSFVSVAGPVYQYRDARSYLYALSGSGTLSVYDSQLSRYIVLLPAEDQFEGSEIYTSYSTQSLQKPTEEGLSNLSSGEMQNIVYMHTVNLPTSGESRLPESGTKVYPCMSSWNYWFVRDGKITCNALFNRQLNPDNNVDPFRSLTRVGDESNGTVYRFGGDELFTSETGDLPRSIAICSDHRFVYYAFAQLLQAAGLVNGEVLLPAYHYNQQARFCAFIPSNEAIGRALEMGSIPGVTGAFQADGTLALNVTDAAALGDYLQGYFISEKNNALADYPYVGSGMQSGDYRTLSTAYPTLTYRDDGRTLSIQIGAKQCRVVPDYDYFPFAYPNGCFHLIEDTF